MTTVAKLPIPTEREEQTALIDWARRMSATYPALRLLYAIPNAGGYRGGFRSNAVRVRRMLEEGVVPGMPDLCLPVAAHGYSALFVEMKRRKRGVTTATQAAVHVLLEAAGNKVAVCAGWDAARMEIEHYVQGASCRLAI